MIQTTEQSTNAYRLYRNYMMMYRTQCAPILQSGKLRLENQRGEIAGVRGYKEIEAYMNRIRSIFETTSLDTGEMGTK